MSLHISFNIGVLENIYTEVFASMGYILYMTTLH